MEQQTDEKKPKIHNTEPSHWPKTVVEIGRTFGVPTLLLLIICYWLVFQITPPIVGTMSEFLASTIETQRELAATQKQIANSQEQLVDLVDQIRMSTEQVVANGKVIEEFITEVRLNHEIQIGYLEKIEAAVTKPQPKPKAAATESPKE